MRGNDSAFIQQEKRLDGLSMGRINVLLEFLCVILIAFGGGGTVLDNRQNMVHAHTIAKTDMSKSNLAIVFTPST